MCVHSDVFAWLRYCGGTKTWICFCVKCNFSKNWSYFSFYFDKSFLKNSVIVLIEIFLFLFAPCNKSLLFYMQILKSEKLNSLLRFQAFVIWNRELQGWNSLTTKIFLLLLCYTRHVGFDRTISIWPKVWFYNFGPKNS